MTRVCQVAVTAACLAVSAAAAQVEDRTQWNDITQMQVLFPLFRRSSHYYLPPLPLLSFLSHFFLPSFAFFFFPSFLPPFPVCESFPSVPPP